MKRTFADAQLTDLLATLSEMVRLRILRLLEAEELSVGEVAKVVQLPQSTVSRHLKVMTEGAGGGWLARRAVGPAMLYRLVLDDLSPQARALWITVRGQLEERSSAELAEDSRRLEAVLAERRLDSQAFFGRIAGEWDEVRSRLFGADFTARTLLALLPPTWVVADLGCGTGNASELLAGYVERVIAVDQSDAMLNAARLRLEGLGNVQFAAGALEKLPLADGSVDATVCMLVLHHVVEPLAALREMRRVVRRGRGGGVSLVVDMIEHDREEYRQTMGHTHLGFPPARMERMMKDAGFDDARTHILPSDPQARGPGLFLAVGRSS
jgi:ubiquinone/menaquinone biosynthesis C-methylase UbiE/DNA-binding MarR family transcriptional regulator